MATDGASAIEWDFSWDATVARRARRRLVRPMLRGLMLACTLVILADPSVRLLMATGERSWHDLALFPLALFVACATSSEWMSASRRSRVAVHDGDAVRVRVDDAGLVWSAASVNIAIAWPTAERVVAYTDGLAVFARSQALWLDVSRLDDTEYAAVRSRLAQRFPTVRWLW